MRTLATVGAAALVFALLGAPPAVAAPAIPLNGGQEAAAGDIDGHGFFTYTLEGTTFCYTLEWQGLDTAVAAHVHRAPRNVAGSVVIPLSVGDGSGTRVSNCVQISAALAADVTADPKAFYVNVHNPAFPAGAIRGQLK
ncbi:MAG TPA: CHRD domain-containing protein [Candidatus Lumbricidophila sp.]|nr:CHRD domain-containing protein [Candidatus Lumbricidophila sp.]